MANDNGQRPFSHDARLLDRPRPPRPSGRQEGQQGNREAIVQDALRLTRGHQKKAAQLARVADPDTRRTIQAEMDREMRELQQLFRKHGWLKKYPWAQEVAA